MNESMNNFIENQKTDLNIGHLIELAREAGVDEDKADKNWGQIDEMLQKAEISKDSTSIQWAGKYLTTYKEGNLIDADLLDLAASLFEIGGSDVLTGQDIAVLTEVLDYQNKENPYPRFRAACALANAGHMSKKVEGVLKEFSNDVDQDVSSIANEYLGDVNHSA